MKLFRVVIYTAAVAMISAVLTTSLLSNEEPDTSGETVSISKTEYEKLNEMLVLDELIELIQSNALSRELTRDELLEGAARGMVEAVEDEYSAYFTDEEYLEYIKNLSGEYVGIGISMATPNEIGSAVLAVHENSPAKNAGVLVGDIITMIDGKSIAGLQLDDLGSITKKKDGEEIALTIKRNDSETFTLTLVAEAVIVNYVHNALLEDDIGYIQITEFSGNVSEEFDLAIDSLKRQGMRALVLDLRNNPGGSLTDVLSVADTLLGKGLIVSIKGRDEETGYEYSSNNKRLKMPIAVLVNQNSASASELLSGAIQDFEAGIVIGQPTFGKGIVQTTMQLKSNGAWVKLTTDEYFTPNGRNIHEIGITPDIFIELPEEYQTVAISTIPKGKDTQLEAAIEYLMGK